MTNLIEPKFEDCVGCIFLHRPRCRKCESGEYFEPIVEELEPEKLELEPGDYDRE